MQTFLEQLGGPERLRLIINTFVDRVVDDVMIGFFFREVDVSRLKEMEFLFAAQFLGGDFRYTGKPLALAHKKHPIMGGHFARRKQILLDVLHEFNIDKSRSTTSESSKSISRFFNFLQLPIGLISKSG